MNADDRLSLNPLGPVEGGNRIVEGSHVANVCPQSTNPDPLDEITQLGTIGYDDEVDSQAARGPRLGRAGNRHQRSSSANHARRPLCDVAAEDIENQIDFGAQEFVDLDNDALEDVDEVDLVFDVIGGDIVKRSAGLIRAGGTLVTVTGPTEARPSGGLTVDFVRHTRLRPIE